LWNEPQLLPNGDLEPEHAEVLRSLRPENQPYFAASTRRGILDRKALEIRRKEVLEKLGCVPLQFLFALTAKPSHSNMCLLEKSEEARRPPSLFAEIQNFSQSYLNLQSTTQVD
jgi:hypothetical protein